MSGHEVKLAGFLVAIWTVKEAVENPGDDPAYARDDYRFRRVIRLLLNAFALDER